MLSSLLIISLLAATTLATGLYLISLVRNMNTEPEPLRVRVEPNQARRHTR